MRDPIDTRQVRARQMRTRIKFCGMTRAEDVADACAFGVDAIGFVFAERSRRRVSPEHAVTLRDALAPFVAAVALFMDNDAEMVREVVAMVRPAVLQFHGGESEGFCRSFGLPYLRAIPMGAPASSHAEIDPASMMRRFPSASAFLLDSHSPGQMGGTGGSFDWMRIPHDDGRPCLLAGGLTPDNVFAAVRVTRCWGVDVSSGIENGTPGVKDAARMRRFVDEVARADHQRADV